MKVRQAGRIVSVAVIVAVGANADGRREALGMAVGPSEAETFWTDFLRSLARRGLRGVKLVISDAHEGVKAAVSKIMAASWRRCRVRFMRNVMAHAGRSGWRMVSAFIATAFAQERHLVSREIHRERRSAALAETSSLSPDSAPARSQTGEMDWAESLAAALHPATLPPSSWPAVNLV